MNPLIEINNYFEKNKGKLSLRALKYDEKYQKKVIQIIAKRFLEKTIKEKLIETLAMMKLDEDFPFDFVNMIYKKYVENEKKDLTSKEKTMFINDFHAYLRKNTQKNDDEIMLYVSKIFNSFSDGYKFEINKDIEAEPDFEYLTDHSFPINDNDNDLIFDEEVVSVQNNAQKNLNPNKIASMCIQEGMPSNIEEITEIIQRNSSFSIALISSMSNIASVMEIKKEMDSRKRENYFKIFRLLDEKTIDFGVSQLITNIKNMVSSDRFVISFYNIWKKVILDYKNMPDYQKEFVMNILNRETSESFENYRKLKEEVQDKKQKETIKSTMKPKINFSDINVSKENLKKINEAIDYISIKGTFNDQILKLISEENTKYEFLKVLISNSCYLLTSEQSKQSTEKTSEIIKPLFNVLLELPIDEYRTMFNEFLKTNYNITGKNVTLPIRVTINKVLLKMLLDKYGKSQENKIYSNITTSLLNKKSFNDDDE